MGLFKLNILHHPDRVIVQHQQETQKVIDQISTYLQQLSGSVTARLSSGSL
jgi:hypothetical protein